MESKPVSNEAVVTAINGRFVQITCKDLPKEHHNRIVNIAKRDYSIGDTGKVIYVSNYNFGLLQFIKDNKA